ncbi:MAG: amidohydrolase [Saprospiraceae bacterium]|jgi:amidohydrolase
MNKAAKLKTDKTLVAIRKDFHANPELSGEEFKTALKVISILSSYQPTKVIDQVGGTGVIAIFDSGNPGKTVLFRAELDALPILEINRFKHRSTVDKVSHKCGHDGHMTILLGLAKRLADHPLKNGKVVLLFQPAEENGQGAKAVLADPKFSKIKPDFVFAFHNLPGYPLNQVVVKKDSFTAEVKSVIIKLKGKTAHAAEPEFGNNPALAIAEILTQSALLSNNKPERDDFVVITPIHIEMGTISYGISAGYGALRLTLRTWTKGTMKVLVSDLLKIIAAASQNHQLNAEINWTHQFAANQNNEQAVNMIMESAIQQQVPVSTREFPFKWGEDFGLFTQKFKGAMFGIGAGEDTPALHNPDYDFPDQMIPLGVGLFYCIASNILDK